jgi:hypothetical protein
LLNRFTQLAEQAGYETVFIEATDDGAFVSSLAANIRRVIVALDRRGALSEAVKRSMRVFKSFSLRFGPDGPAVAIDVDPEPGRADSGELASDLEDLFVAVGEAAGDRGRGVLVAVDELQYLAEAELAALIKSIHRSAQLQLPLIVAGAGLPSLPALSGEAKSYAERLFDFPEIGRLSPVDAAAAIVEPARAEGVDFADDAVMRRSAVICAQWRISVRGRTAPAISRNGTAPRSRAWRSCATI